MALEEIVHISGFDIQPNGCINVRKTIEIVRDGNVVSRTFWRCALAPNDPQASEVLNEPYYAAMAQAAWTPEVIAAYQEHMAAQQAKMGVQP